MTAASVFVTGLYCARELSRPHPKPAISEIDAGDDRIWFADNPYRLFRVRISDAALWLVRRNGSRRDGYVMLRSPAPDRSIPRDDDLHIGAVWCENAFGLEPQKALKAARALLRRQKLRGPR